MMILRGPYTRAICYTDEVEESALKQIEALCYMPEFEGARIRIMPDVHAGIGCTIGTTIHMPVGQIIPNLVGVDIGCGIDVVKLEEKSIDFDKLDRVIREKIPSGRHIRETPTDTGKELGLEKLRCAKHVNIERARLSLGTLGGGNHFIEVDRADDGALYLLVHSGSRGIGNEVATFYQKAAYDDAIRKINSDMKQDIVDLKLKGLTDEISVAVQKYKDRKNRLDKNVAFVTGDLFDDYMDDLGYMQFYACLNRIEISSIILKEMDLWKEDSFRSIHNYIEGADGKNIVVRKGAVSAKKDELFILPLNMRDGSLICKGKGNEEWNFSAPHGAGRIMSRSDARSRLNMDDYKKEMEGIYTTSVAPGTLDEAPMAYKPMDAIVNHIYPTADIISHIKPVYNYKHKE